MSAAWVVLGLGWIFLLAFTVALVLSRASRERDIRRQVAADIRGHAAEVARFRPNGDYAKGMRTAALIAEGMRFDVSPGFVTADGSGNVRKAGDWRWSS